MFALCLKIIKAAQTSEERTSGNRLGVGFIKLKSQIKSGNIALDMIEANETKRVSHTTLTKTTPAKTKANGAREIKTPAPVATPLPPRNFNHILTVR
jgi:hypothetical protein